MQTTLARSLFATALSLLLAFALPALGATVTITPTPTNGNVTSNVGGINCGNGGSSCTSGSIALGTTVILTATPNTGYSFVQWTVTGGFSGTSTSNPLSFPMPSTSVSGSATFVGTAPTITSANTTAFTELTPGTFTVTATGTPAPTFAVTAGSLPSGVTLSSTGTLSGTPASGTAGSYPVTITASNGVTPNATQSFTLVVQSPPAITSANTTSFAISSPGTFTITSTGTPTATISLTGTLPTGVSFTTPVAGQGVISGTPASGTGGSYPLTITAANGILPNATQTFTLTVVQAPSITSASSTSFAVGAPGTFNFTASGSPAPAFTVTSGGLPEGITLSSSGVLSGTPANGTAGVYNISVTASNGIPSDATVAFTLNVTQAPGLVATPIVNFDGLGKDFTWQGAFSVGVAPSDSDIAVGPNHIVQVVNSSYAVFSKAGTALQGPIAFSTLWIGSNHQCDQATEPVVRYDRAADRFIIMALVGGSTSSGGAIPALLCVALSATGDPTGSYAASTIPLASNSSPPYSLYESPRLGVWPDGYYVTFNVFSGMALSTVSFQGSTIFVLNRSTMLAGQAPTAIRLDTWNQGSYYTLVPSDRDGPNAPPAGAPNTMLALDATTANKLDVLQMHVDWNTFNNTTLTEVAILDTAAFARPCPLSDTCIPQGGTPTSLDAPAGQLLYRAAYRNFGDHESIVVVHHVNTGSIIGMRWYELRNLSTSPTIFQQGTFAPDSDHRWMGSGAMDGYGDLALGYSVSSSTIKPQIRYAARRATDAAGQLSMGEATIFAGAGAQTGGLTAWGYTSSLHIDPSDDCTFWYTNQYLPADGSFNWRTRIASFQPLGLCPTAPLPTTYQATAITAISATLNGAVSANGALTTVTFEYGTTTAYGTVVPLGTVDGSANTQPVSADITFLTCGTVYHYRLNATNAAGTTNGNDVAFATAACPFVTTGLVGTVTSTTATLAGTVSTLVPGTVVTFEYGTTTAYGATATAAQSPLPASPNSVNVTADVSGLSCGTIYHFRADATATGVLTTGTDSIFQTVSCSPNVTASSPGAIPIGTQGVFTATVSNPNGVAMDVNLVYSGLPAGVAVQGGTFNCPSSAAFTPQGGALLILIPGLAPQGSCTLSFVLTGSYVSSGVSSLVLGTDPTQPGIAIPVAIVPNSPLVLLNTPSPIGTNSVTFNYRVDPRGADAAVYLQINNATAFGIGMIPALPTGMPADQYVPSSFALAGLTCGTNYSFVISAQNMAGNSSPVDGAGSFNTSACAAPGAPTIGAANAGDGQATIAFTAPASDGGSPITSYTVTCTPGPKTATGSGSPITVTALTNGTLYTCSAAATNAVGTGASSGTVTVTPISLTSAPSATTNAATAVTTTSATLNGAVSANGASTTVAFDYGTTTSYGNTIAAAQSPLSSSSTSAAVSASVTGLSCGTLYHYRVNATNSVGTTHGNDSTFNTAGCPTAPGIPNIINIRPGDGKATVLFLPVNNDGGSPVLQYTAICQPGSHTGGGTSSPLTVTGLTNGTTYSCSLTATNAIGTGLASLPSNVTPAAATSTSYAFIPDTSTNQGHLSIVDLSSALVVKTLTLGPGTLGGVAANPADGKAYVVVWGQNDHIAQIDTSTLTVTATLPLPANTGGGNLVVSPNGARLYQASAALGQIQVVDVATQSLVGSIPVDVNPGSMGFDATGSKLYVVNNSRLTILDTQTSTVLATITQGSLPTPLAGPARAVAAGIIDTYVTTANINSSAVSVVDSSSNAVLTPISSAVLPAANPGAIAVAPNGHELWVADPTAGKVYFYDVVTTSFGSFDASAPSAIAFDATGSVAAVSSATTGITTLVDPVAHLPFATVATPTPPSTFAYFITSGPLFSAIPGAPIASTGTASIISATGATMNGTVSADGFSTTVTFDYGTTATYGTSVAAAQSPLASSAISSAVTATVTGLACGTLYHFRVNATNSAGTTHGTDATFTTSACATTPGAPSIGGGTSGNTQATIAFAPPASDGGSPITSYTVSCTPGPITATGAASPITVTGLANGTTYTCSVAATNAVGTGASSGTVSVTPVSNGVPPTITSANHTTFIVNAAGSFTVTDTGVPTPTLLMIGSPPSGVTFTTATGVLAGTPALGTVGVYSLTFNANSTTLPNASQAFTLTVAKANQTITFSNPGAQTVSATPVALSASASSGLAVSFTSLTTTVCTVSGTQLTLKAAGSCTIAADQAGDANYNAAAQVQQTFAVSETPRLSGISTRMTVLTGDNVMIAGFVIGGSTAKTVVVRARGPSLGVAGALADTVLTLVPADGSPVIANDDWGTAANAAQLQALGYQPGNVKESAIMATLNPGAYTAIVSGAAGTTGIAIVEVYELDHPEIPMVGISTRGLVQTGDNVMIGGFIIQGSGPQTVAVRARGPSLGVAGALADPTLTIVPGDGSPPMSNDDWASAANAAQLLASGFAPANAKESALLLTLNPGAYTAIVGGVGGTTGVSIVEVYALP